MSQPSYLVIEFMIVYIGNRVTNDSEIERTPVVWDIYLGHSLWMLFISRHDTQHRYNSDT